MKKRLLSVFLTLMMLLTLVPTTALAAGAMTVDVEPPAGRTLSTLQEGDVVKVTVRLPQVASTQTLQFDLNFDDTYFSYNGDGAAPDIIAKLNIGKVDISGSNIVRIVATGLTPASFDAGTVAMQASFTVKAGVTGSTKTFGLSGLKIGDPSVTLPTGQVDVTIIKAPITSVTAKVDAPQKGVELDTTVDIGGATGYTAKVEWYEGTTATGSPVTGKAKPNQFYYAKITLKANPGETFADTLTTGKIIDIYSVTRVSDTVLTLTKAYDKTADAEVTKVQIAGTPPTLNVPVALGIDQPGTVTATNTYSVTVFMDGSPVVKPSGVVWSISDLAGVTVDPATGNMTISSNCPGGKIELTATYGGKSDTAKLTVWRATPAVKWLKIVDPATGGEPQTTIIRPVGTESTDMIDVDYEARGYDQFSQPATITGVDWTWNHLPEHMGTLETVGGPYKLRLHVFHNTETIPFDLTATLKAAPTAKDTITIKVEEKALETLTVTQADTTYGTALAAPVFTQPEGTTRTFIHYSTPTSSAYSSDTPPTDAGEYVVNVLCETATHIYMGHDDFKINPKSISNMLQPITGTYTYTGAPQKPPAVVKDGEETLVEGTDYTVSYGTNVHVFEAATVYVEGIGNYTGTFSRNFKIQPKPIDIEDVSTTNRDYEEGRLDVDCTVKLPVASDVKQGEHYLVFATMADDTAGTNKTVNVQVKMVKGGLGENYTLKNDTTTATVNINKINPADPTGLKGVKGQKLSAVELPAGWTWYAPSMVMDTAGKQTFLVNYAGDANHNDLYMHPITVNVLEKTDVSTFITFPNGEKEYTGSWMEYKEASISGTNLGTNPKWEYTYAAGTGTLMEAGFPQGVGTYTVTATYEDSLNFGIATATLTIVPRKVTIPAADTTVFTYDGTAKTYGIADTADYTVTGATQTNANESGYTVTVALKDKTNTAWTDGTTTDKTYTFKIMKAASTGEPAYTKITTSGKTLKDAGLTVTGSTLKPNAGTLEWVDDKDNVLPDTTTVAANTTYKWRFTPDDANYKVLTGFIELYHESSSGGGIGVTTYPITVKSTKNGDVTASHKSAAKGTTVTLTVAPDKGYVLDALTVLDGKDKEIKLTEKNGKYTFTMPDSKVTVEAAFKAEQSTGKNPFTDVPAGSYYEDAVIWAVDKGITTGTSATTFDPNGICTRAQAVTFLWRAAGSPAAKSGAMPFADVKVGSYCYDAVLWAVEQGITKGTSETMFSPDATCTRAQIVTFLWRSQKSPAAGTANPFTDVKASAYYADAVLWAVKEDVTKGTTNTTFSPDATCTRAQIVTFIYRSVK